jgi:hypothetical protein
MEAVPNNPKRTPLAEKNPNDDPNPTGPLAPGGSFAIGDHGSNTENEPPARPAATKTAAPASNKTGLAKPRKRKSDAIDGTTPAASEHTSNAKKPKTTAARAGASQGLTDVSDITLDGELDCSVPVYMTCDEVRRYMKRQLAKPGVSKASLARALTAMYPTDSGKTISSANVTYFLGRKGVRGGNTCDAFYAGYCFFEKERIKLSKKKTDWRRAMEEEHGLDGFDLVNGTNTGYWVMRGSKVFVNRYGRVTTDRFGLS